MDSGIMDPSGRDATNAGKICGIIATVFTAFGLVVATFIFLTGFAVALTGHAH
jgi:hypothetical protein